jgi:hypothetical protein
MSLSITTFYETRKNLFDICGNITNKDKYQFINILSDYLKDIVSSIDNEIQKSTRNSMINWKEKKNPKLLSKIINNDDNINLINKSMNKITHSNYLKIVKEITTSIMEDTFRQLQEYSHYIFDIVIKKCLIDEHLISEYLYFVNSFENEIGNYIYEYLDNYINLTFGLFDKKIGLKDYTYNFYIKDILNYYNIGKLFGYIHLLQENETIINKSFFTKNLFYNKIKSCLTIINDYLDWEPSNMDELYSRIYLVFGIIDILNDKLFSIFTETDVSLLTDILKQIYNNNTISNKIKFKVLDIQDMISKFEKNNKKKPIEKSIEKSIEKPIEKPIEKSIEKSIEKPIEKPIENINKYKPINYANTLINKTINNEIINNKYTETLNTQNIINEPIGNKLDNKYTVKKNTNNNDKQLYKKKYNKNNNSHKYKNNKNIEQTTKHKQEESNIDDDGFIKIERKNKTK